MFIAARSPLRDRVTMHYRIIRSKQMTTIKALSVRQPWADLIIRGIKAVENRSWSTKYRGPLLIHTGQKFDDRCVIQQQAQFNIDPDALPYGAIVGIVDLDDIVTSHHSQFFTGPYGWVLTNPRRFHRPITLRGRMGLFDVPSHIINPRRAVSR
jgi:hypothetical protein